MIQDKDVKIAVSKEEALLESTIANFEKSIRDGELELELNENNLKFLLEKRKKLNSA